MTAELSLVQQIFVSLFAVLGSFFLAVGTIGLIRLPDVFNRMHATTKATTLGAGFTFLAGFTYYGPQGAGLTAVIGILFLFMTAPTGAHLISRAAHRMGIDFYGDAKWPEEE